MLSVVLSVQAMVPQAAGLDIGWGQRVQLQWEPRAMRHSLDLNLLPGTTSHPPTGSCPLRSPSPPDVARRALYDASL